MIYIVKRISDGVEVCRYAADAPIEWQGFEFAEYTHIALPSTDPLPAAEPMNDPREWFINVGPFFDRFGNFKLSILASTDPYVQAVVKDASVRQYIDLKGRRAELLQAIGLLQSKGFAVDPAAVLDVKPNTDEVHRG